MSHWILLILRLSPNATFLVMHDWNINNHHLFCSFFTIYIIFIDGAGLLNVPLLPLLLASLPQFDPRPESFRAKPWTSHPFSYHFKWSCHDHHGHHEHHDDYAQFRRHHSLDQSLSELRSRLSNFFPQELPQIIEIFCSVRIWILPGTFNSQFDFNSIIDFQYNLDQKEFAVRLCTKVEIDGRYAVIFP